MAKYKGAKCKIKAVLRTNPDAMCIFCNSLVNDELVYGNFYTLQDISCHYFCVLLSSCAMQHGNDDQGLFGFLYSDIKEEAERGKKHRCSYCHKLGATLGCSVGQCRKQFHLPCGRERNAVSIFHGSYKSFCEQHVPKQHIPANIMEIAKSRKSLANKEKKGKCEPNHCEEQSVICLICCEPVPGYPSPESFWPPCCAKDVWFHRLCIQRTALSAGVHYLKCPLCNDKEVFYKTVVSQGIYVPDRDASWELEQNAYNDMYERPNKCTADQCICPTGRDQNDDDGEWEIRVCLLCGSGSAHSGCSQTSRFICGGCKHFSVGDLDAFAEKLEAVRLQECTNRARSRRRPLMPSRMSLRRTKQYAHNAGPSTSRAFNNSSSNNVKEVPPSRSTNKFSLEQFSPLKLLDEGIRSKIMKLDRKTAELLTAQIREKLSQPMPLTQKKKIIISLIEDLMTDLWSPIKTEGILSPAKYHDLNTRINKKKIPKLCFDNIPNKKEVVSERDSIVKKEDISPEDITNEKITQNNTNEEVANKENIMINSNESYYTDSKTSNITDIETNLINSDNKIVKSPNENENNNMINNLTEEIQNNIKLTEIETNNINLVNNKLETNSPTIETNCIKTENNIEIKTTNETQTKLKTIDIEQNSSIEISESEESIHVDIIQIDETPKSSILKEFLLNNIPEKCSLKFSSFDKEVLDDVNKDIDMESFKNQYLNEVGNTFKCHFNHKHNENRTPVKIDSVIGFAVDAALKKEANITDEEKLNRKRKLLPEDKIPKKKHKKKHKRKINQLKIRLKVQKKQMKREKQKALKKVNNPKTPVKVIDLINESPKNFKQMVLNFSPENEIKSPIKSQVPNKIPKIKKPNKNSPKDDHYKQTSLFSFFVKT